MVTDAERDTLDRLLRERRTIHDFEPEPVPEALLLEALELAQWVPNHKRTFPWRFHLLGPEARARVVARNAELVEAKKGPDAAAAKRTRWSTIPGWLVVTCALDADPIRRQEDLLSAGIAVHNLSLALWARGVGVKWTTGPVTRDDALYSVLGVERTAEQVVGVLWYGRAARVPVQDRPPLEERLTRHP